MIKRLLKKGSEQIVKGYEYYRVAIQQEMEDRIRERCKYGYAERQPLLQQQHDILGSSSSDQQSSLGPQYHHDHHHHHHHHQAPPPQSLYYQLISPPPFPQQQAPLPHQSHSIHLSHPPHHHLTPMSSTSASSINPPPPPQQLHHQIFNSPSLASSTYHHQTPPRPTPQIQLSFHLLTMSNNSNSILCTATTMAALTVH